MIDAFSLHPSQSLLLFTLSSAFSSLMVGCETRSFSFTHGLLGISADELHLCGDPAVVPLIQKILKITGDSIKDCRSCFIFRLRHYERLSPLIRLSTPLGSFSNIQTGDCILTFSWREIYKLKREIEDGGRHLCSVVYGSLPPETRNRQVELGDMALNFPRGK